MKSKFIILSVAFAVSFGFTGVCSAETIFTDNFDSYPLYSDLNGKGGWSGSGQVIDYFVYEGTQSVKITELNGTFFGGLTKRGSLVNDGQITIYARSIGGGNFNGQPRIELKEGTTSIIRIQQVSGLGYAYYNGDVGGFTSLGPAPNPWVAFQIQWRSSDHKARYNVNGGPWTAWHPALANWTAGLDTVGIYSRDGSSVFDAIGENFVKTPVLIMPGLLGTEMQSQDELLWLNLGKMFTDIGDNFMDSLSFDNALNPIISTVSPTNVISKKNFGPIEYDYADGLINEFIGEGYVENENLFTFPHDWRYGASGENADGKTNSDLLGEKIQEILTQTGRDKVDVVAHSQGGLVVKKYVADNPASHHIGKAVFVGVPNTGAPKSVKVLLQGDRFGIPWLSESEMKKIAKNMPTAYDLLPSQKYYDVKGSFVKVIDQGLLGDTAPSTVKDLNYEEFKSYITGDHSLNSQGLTGAESLHTQAFDDVDLRTTGVDLYAIDGCKAPTISNIVENRAINVFGQNVVDYKALKWGRGDGTVPLESATNLPINQANKFYALTGEHSKMMSQDGTRQKIVNILTGSALATGSKITQNINECKLNGKAISVFSPIDILVTDRQGNKMGNDGNGNILNEIPNASFEVMGEHKFLYLPTDGRQTYDIKITGTGAGTYTVTNQNIVENEVIGAEVFSNLPVTANLTGQINLGTQTTLTVKENPRSNPVTILPSSTVDANGSEDYLPPVSSITLSGAMGQTGFYRSDVGISIDVTDTVSGVLVLNYNIDGAGYQKVLASSATLSISNEGSHTVTFFSTDKAGNNEQEQKISFVVDKTAPEAVIEFDPAIKDLTFLTQESDINIIDNNDVATFTDKAGNMTEIILQAKNRKELMRAEIKSLKYNGMAVDMSQNSMEYSWNLNSNGNVRKLSQYIKSRVGYSISAFFDGRKTKITGKDAFGYFSTSFSGLKIIKVITDKGDFKWSY